MKIIHCADIHLDSKINANLSATKSKQRKAEVLASFCNMIDYASREDVRVVIIAGDLFDSNHCSDNTVQVVLSHIASAENTDFLYLPGNHDAGKSLQGMATPDNLKFFGEDWITYKYGDVNISGAVLTDDNCRGIYGGLITEPDKLNIAVMHGARGYISGEDMINLNELADKNINYLALGHYHSFECGELSKNGEWCYSGCLEGRGFDECGDKGFVLLETDGKTYKKQFIKAAKRDIIGITCDISGLFDMGDIHKKVMDEVKTLNPEALVRLALSGDIPEETVKDIDFLAEKLNSMFYFAKVVDETRVKIDPNKYVGDISLKGEFIRKVMESGLDEETASRVIECGLAALKGREVF